MQFALKGFKGETVHCSSSMEPIEIKGKWHFQGRQPISNDGGAPQFISELFEQNENIEAIAIKTKNGGKVYAR
jgi:hypothetical protein